MFPKARWGAVFSPLVFFPQKGLSFTQTMIDYNILLNLRRVPCIFGGLDGGAREGSIEQKPQIEDPHWLQLKFFFLTRLKPTTKFQQSVPSFCLLNFRLRQ